MVTELELLIVPLVPLEVPVKSSAPIVALPLKLPVPSKSKPELF